MIGAAQSPPIVWEDTVLAGAESGVRVRVFRPEGETAGWLVWAHGGSWVGGSVEMWHLACADLAARAGCTIVSVDYRLAPRHRHPAALDDLLLGLDWASARSAEGGTGGRLAVGGDSAGGTLAACAALVWRDLHRPLAVHLLVYPPLDPGCRAASYTRRPAEFPSRDGLIAAWRSYRGNDYDHRTGRGLYSTPLEAADLDDLAPAVVGVGELDPVADDVQAYAGNLRAAGNTVHMRIFPGMGHGTFLQGAGWTGTDGANGDALRRWLAGALRAQWDEVSVADDR